MYKQHMLGIYRMQEAAITVISVNLDDAAA